jgi:hypothetical protein
MLMWCYTGSKHGKSGLEPGGCGGGLDAVLQVPVFRSFLFLHTDQFSSVSVPSLLGSLDVHCCKFKKSM